MSQSFTSDSLQRLFSYPFQDPRWKEKLAVAAALSLAGMVIPIIPSLFVYGYAARIVRHVIRNGEPIPCLTGKTGGSCWWRDCGSLAWAWSMPCL